MKRNISLYIAGTKVDLDDNSLILFNYAMTDLTNPTIVKNSYSHQVKLKGTKTNNKLFGEIFRLDRETIYSDSYTGVNFDPMRKTPFEIYDETSTCLESGYVKLNSISRNGADISYSITLYGGLGSFFYGLSYKEDGTKKTLADLKWKDSEGNDTTFQLSDVVTNGKDIVEEAWQNVQAGGAATYKFWQKINFAPAYNGLPKDFDSNKGIINSGYDNVGLSKSDSGTTYVTKDGCGYARVLFTNKHTEWEVKDLRWYLQRPILNLRAIVDTISDPMNNGGYIVEIENAFFGTAKFKSIWLTLPMIATEDRASDNCLYNCLKATNTPADYLLSIIKMFNLVVVSDSVNKVIKIVRRKKFYQKNVIDFSGRVSFDKSIKPLAVESRRYQMGQGVQGQYAEDYKEEYGFDYGIKRIDTGYEFNNTTTVLTDSVAFKGAAEVLEKNMLFQKVLNREMTKEVFIYPAFEGVDLELWYQKANDDKVKKFPLSASLQEYIMRDLQGNVTSTNITFFNSQKYSDLFSKLQLHGEDNSPLEGSNVLVFYNGTVTTGFYKLSNDPPYQDLLNEGQPCWDLTYKESWLRIILPVFQRLYVTVNDFGFEVATECLEWGVPKRISTSVDAGVRSVPDIYTAYWKNYLSDLYDDNTRVLNCKVNLRGLTVNQELFKNFYWLDNALWALSKISNYSLTTFDDAECELIKVNDIENYTN